MEEHITIGLYMALGAIFFAVAMTLMLYYQKELYRGNDRLMELMYKEYVSMEEVS